MYAQQQPLRMADIVNNRSQRQSPNHNFLTGLGDGTDGQCLINNSPYPGVSPEDWAACQSLLNIPLSANSGSRGAVDKLICTYPDDIKQQLMKGLAKFTDYTFFSRKVPETATTIKMFEPNFDKLIGVTNVKNAQLEANEMFVLWAIQLQSTVSLNPNLSHWNRLVETGVDSVDGAVSTLFTSTNLDAAILNGWHSLAFGASQVRERMPNTVFSALGTNTERNQTNLWVLDSPILILSGNEWKFEIEIATALPANTNVRVDFHGQLCKFK